MSFLPDDVRREFSRECFSYVKVTPRGFDIDIDDEVVEELRGRVVKATVIRKLFEDSVLTCDSKDGVTGREGIVCAQCRHLRCRPMMRIHFLCAGINLVIDLAPTSAQNLVALEQRGDVDLETAELNIAVIDRGHWGEVTFQVI
jgi:hypothetical protein